jgi:hypothetical protein
MIYEHDCDTQLPNNIFDDEFHPGSKELPPSRPASEPTPISYMNAKAKLCFELGNILQATNKIGTHVPYDEIIRFDAKLQQIMQELPPHLKLTPLEGTRDPVTLIIARFNVDILCQKILCLLHRKYVGRARQNPRYAHSRRSAIDASLRALGHLSTLHRESQSNGRLRSIGWYIKSIATKDFMLPTMMLVLDLHYDNVASQSGESQDSEGAFLWSPEQRSKMISALQEIEGIWKTLADTSMEAYKACKIIEIMLEKIQNPAETDESSFSGRTDSVSTMANSFGVDPSPLPLPQGMLSPSQTFPDFQMNGLAAPESSAFMGGMDFGLSPGTTAELSADAFGATGTASPFSAMFTSNGGAPDLGADIANNFDWVRLGSLGPLFSLIVPPLT